MHVDQNLRELVLAAKIDTGPDRFDDARLRIWTSASLMLRAEDRSIVRGPAVGKRLVRRRGVSLPLSDLPQPNRRPRLDFPSVMMRPWSINTSREA